MIKIETKELCFLSLVLAYSFLSKFLVGKFGNDSNFINMFIIGLFWGFLTWKSRIIVYIVNYYKLIYTYPVNREYIAGFLHNLVLNVIAFTSPKGTSIILTIPKWFYGFYLDLVVIYFFFMPYVIYRFLKWRKVFMRFGIA